MNKKRFTSSIISALLILVMALSMVGCGNKEDKDTSKEKVTTATQETTEGTSESNVIGEGSKAFEFTVVDTEGKETVFEVHTDKEIVGEALLENELIAGDEGDYGLYVKTVNGITVDYDKDGKYWAFYVNGEYASSGVDTTTITEGDTYTFKVE